MLCGTGGAVMVFAYWFGVGSLSVLFFVMAQQPVTAKTAVNRHVVMIVTFFFIMVNGFNIRFLCVTNNERLLVVSRRQRYAIILYCGVAFAVAVRDIDLDY